MKNLLPFLFLAISLGSCNKGGEDLTPTVLPAPNPTTATLLARWQLDSTWVSGTTAATLYQKNNLMVFPPTTANAEFIGTQYILYSGIHVAAQSAYSQNGNVINIGGTDPSKAKTIKVLTPTRLVLTSPTLQGVTRTTTYSR